MLLPVICGHGFLVYILKIQYSDYGFGECPVVGKYSQVTSAFLGLAAQANWHCTPSNKGQVSSHL